VWQRRKVRRVREQREYLCGTKPLPEPGGPNTLSKKDAKPKRLLPLNSFNPQAEKENDKQVIKGPRAKGVYARPRTTDELGGNRKKTEYLTKGHACQSRGEGGPSLSNAKGETSGKDAGRQRRRAAQK